MVTKPKVRGGKAYAGWTGLRVQPLTDGIHTTYDIQIVGPLTPDEQDYLVERMDARPRMLRQREALAHHRGSKNRIVQAHVRSIKAIHGERLARFLKPLPKFSPQQWIDKLSDDERSAYVARAQLLNPTAQDDADLAQCDHLLSIINTISKPRRAAQKTRKDTFHRLIQSGYDALLRTYKREPVMNELRQALIRAGAREERRPYRGAERNVLIVYNRSTGHEAGTILNTDRALRDALGLAKAKAKPATKRLAR